MKKKIRLTKARLQALDHKLAFDDILYEKFRRLNEALDMKYRQLYRAERIVEVLQAQTTFPRGRLLKSLVILEIHVTSDGTQVVVGDSK